jgi:hypothetical protein
MKMFSYIYSLVYGEDEVKADEKQLRQKYLVLQQIKDHKIRLKPINKKAPMIMRTFKKKVLP